ncbi:sodium channel protein 60E-like [Limulus polyphemus]|uniref:Sodium channel protein n=1 Tax=Limulus polyphemus TaxID=6850 RepID=A0ABM1T841_LIMPO|nr:sodium channel protein 60E-like [Limulus polyphemus]
MITILVNCVFLAMTNPIEETEFVFLAIYTMEMIVKSVARGFILSQYTYLRNPWNWLDFIVVLAGYITLGVQAFGMVEIGSLAGLRTFRVLRALKTMSVMPGVWSCPAPFLCRDDVGENPNYGYTNFDTFGWSVLTTLQLITVDYWEDVYNKLIAATGPASVLFFTVVIFFGSFYLVNLTLAVVAIAYEAEAASTKTITQVKESECKKMLSPLASLLSRFRSKSNSLEEPQQLIVTNTEHDLTSSLSLGMHEDSDSNQEPLYSTSDGASSLIPSGPWSPGNFSLSSETVGESHPFGVAPDLVMSVGEHLPSRRTHFQRWKLRRQLHVDDSSISGLEDNSNIRTQPRQAWNDIQAKNRCFDTAYVSLKMVRKYLQLVVEHPLFELSITCCIVLNTALLASEHHGMPSSMAYTLSLGNLVFTVVFAIEALIKLVALGVKFFSCKWNIFDLIIVAVSLADLALETVSGLSVLRMFRLLRVLKLARSWPTMRLLLKIVIKTLGAVGHMTIVLALVIYIFAVLGMQLFSDIYTAERFAPHPIPRWNFTDFVHSLLMVFRVLCGEWVECLWDCMKASSYKRELCITFFVSTLLVGNFLVLNLFLALLLNSFNSEGLREGEGQTSSTIISTLTKKINGLLTYCSCKREAEGVVPEIRIQSPTPTSCKSIEELEQGTTSPEEESLFVPPAVRSSPPPQEQRDETVAQGSNLRHCEGDVVKRIFIHRVRRCIQRVVDNKIFEWLVFLVIFASSLLLCFEDVYLAERPMWQLIIDKLNLAFTVFFVIEMLLQWGAHGFIVYFTSLWTILDFSIVCVSVLSLLLQTTGTGGLYALRVVRVLRALRPLRAISRWQGIKIVVNALMSAIPSIFNVLLVCVAFWLIFGIMGVQLFGGHFYTCVNQKGQRLSPDVTANISQCLELNYTWVNAPINFDNIGNAYLALFQVATFEGWMEVMTYAMDTTSIGNQPYHEANIPACLYFVIFIVCGSFFTLNLFIGVIIDNFNLLKKKYETGVLEMFLTENQRTYYTAMKKLGRKKPQRIIQRPQRQLLAYCYDISMSRRFELLVFLLILLNMTAMAFEHYQQSHTMTLVLWGLNILFTATFTLEGIIKILGLGRHYFTVSWNVFDFFIALTSVIGVIFEEALDSLGFSPTLLRVIRLFRIGRVLRLIKAADGIRKLLFALVISLPALVNIGALLLLIMFIYAIIGMSLFSHVKKGGALTEYVNFETFAKSMLLLLRLTTSAGWNDVLHGLMVEPPDCDMNYKNLPNGNCGYPLVAVMYLVSYIIISFMIVINMYIAVLLENLNQATQEQEVGITEEDVEMFYVCWARYDPRATQFIQLDQVLDFVANLGPPLGIPRPNRPALVAMDLPVSRENKVHCLDVLHALTKLVLGHVDDTEEFRKLQRQLDQHWFQKTFPTRRKVEIVTSTLEMKKRENAARVIQRAFRHSRLKK